MPLTHFVDPVSGESVEIEDAPSYFEERGIVPSDIMRSMIENIEESEVRRTGVHLSPSIADPDVTCKRELAIRRFLPYKMDPRVLFDAIEGTIWHSACAHAGKGEEGWMVEVNLDGVEVLPGLTLSGTVDRISTDLKKIYDLKTKRYSRKDWPISRSWEIQVNLYAYMVEDYYDKPGVVQERYIWRMLRGSYERERTFRLYPIPKMTRAELQRVCGNHLEELRGWLQELSETDDIEEREKLIAGMPMDGERMFAGKKCTQYCPVREVCFGLAGVPKF